MKKLFLFSFVLVVFFGSAFFAFAAESLSFYYDYDSDYESSSPGIISPGLYDYVLTCYSSVNGESLVFSGTGNFISVIENDIPFVYFVFSSSEPSIILTFVFADGSLLDMSGYTFSVLDPSESTTIDFSLDLVRHHNSDFISSINSGLSSVLSWIHSFSSAFTSGSLSPLFLIFLIGISITLLFFVIMFICKTSWGC